MQKRDKQALREDLRSDGWHDEDIDSVIEDAEEVEQLMVEDECFFAEFMEANMEDTPNA